MSKGEFRSVCQAVGGINAMINEDCKDRDALAIVKYISEEQKEEKLLANQQVIKTPIVRNGKQATVGDAPEVWKGWMPSRRYCREIGVFRNNRGVFEAVLSAR